MSTTDRFPRPWRVEESDAAFVVRDARGVIVGRAEARPGVTRDEAREIAQKMVMSAEALSAASKVERERTR